MVLLTSSAISVAISSGVVCLFTFLLFLSGYVLQQQTVRSLQEALQVPVEVRVRVQPGLQRQFESAEDVLLAVAEGEDVTIETQGLFGDESIPTQQIIEINSEVVQQEILESLDGIAQELTLQQLWHAHLDKTLGSQQLSIPKISTNPAPTPLNTEDTRLAYVLSLPTPADLCSALLFTKHHRQSSLYPASNFNIIYLYPSSWETSSSPVYRDALSLLIQAEHSHSVLLHPVQISKIWNGIDVESQLLSELARNPWIYDRVMYVRLPGMLVDTARLDEMMVESYMTPRIVKEEWTKLRAPVRRGAAPAEVLRPDVLMFAQGRGLMVPVSERARSITSKAGLSLEERTAEEMKGEGSARDAAFVLFEEEMLKRKRKEKHSHEELFKRFERERRRVCEGTLLLS